MIFDAILGFLEGIALGVTKIFPTMPSIPIPLGVTTFLIDLLRFLNIFFDLNLLKSCIVAISTTYLIRFIVSVFKFFK